MSKHTPGPWYWNFDRDQNWSLCSDSAADVIMDQRNCPLIEDRILIEAAPDLLECLETIKRRMYEPRALMLQDFEAMIDIAIAKAKGEPCAPS